MRIPESTLSEIRDKIDIAEVIGEHVALQRKGGRYWGLCPFHQEKSPSFTVTPEKGVFYCFGCRKGGTVFDFIMEVEKVPWRDAVELLARKAGVEIPRDDEERGGVKRDAYVELLRRVVGSFHWLLTEGPQAEEARAYLQRRGVTRETLDAFQLGYAPSDREWLFRFLTQKSYSADFLGRVGLFIDNARGRGGALFANRIMFPIANARGEVIAFGGRALGDGQPKYLNSPETPFFRKGENLFGIDKAGPAIRQAGFFIIVEGYMDVLAMHQAGIANCVAPLGTALTEQQVRTLKRWAGKGLLLFDGDAAGQKATARGVELLEREDMLVQVVELPDDQDPADLVQKGQEALLKRLLEHPREGFPYLLDKAFAANDRSSTEGRQRIRDNLFPYIAAAQSPLKRDGYLSLLADFLEADVQAVRQDFSAWQSRRKLGPQRGPQGPAQGDAAASGGERSREPTGGMVSTDLFLMLAVAANPDLFPLVRNGGVACADLEDKSAQDLWLALEEAFRAEESGFDSICARIETPSLRDLAMSKASSGEFELNPERIVRDGVRRVRQRMLQKRIESVILEMRRTERASGDESRRQELLAEKVHLDEELNRLKIGAAGA
jgi:DNA primase